MWFGILGPIEVRHGERLFSVGSARERFVLATLLLNAGRVTLVDTLIDALWVEPPASAKAQLHNMVSNVRRRLRGCGECLITSRSGGYELCLGQHKLDLLEFRRLAVGGRQAVDQGDHVGAVSALTGALALWRGPALADVPAELVAGVRQALHEEKFSAAEAMLDAWLAVGRNDEVLRAIPSLTAEHPYRETLHEKHMLALVGAGRRTDALERYREVHRRFVDELGVEPGPSLRELEQRILRGEGATAPRVGADPVPRQLPPPVVELTGRDKLLGEITSALRIVEEPVAPVVLLVGPGGVGKTVLALAAAHRLASAFPDGQLYADLRGNQAGRTDPHAIVGRFLRALGVDGSALPEDPDERVAMYRSRLAGKWTLVVLDDVASEEQVRPLLVGGDGCRTLITSRYQLGALVGATRWTVPVLAASDALDLFAAIVGGERVAAEPDAATEIVGLCAHLPLAVSIAAARLAVHGHWTLDEFRGRLAEERGRLDELSVGDLDVRASIALSYDTLDPETRRLLRRIGLVDAPTWPAWIVDPLAGGPAGHLLEALIDAHLVEPLGRDAVGQHRFRLHDLVADFAAERALAEDGEPERTEALSRLLSGWLGLATEADARIPHDMSAAPELDRPAPPSGAAPLVRDLPGDWFEVERRNLVLAVDQACRLGLADLAGTLALRLAGFLGLRSYHDDWDHTLRQAVGCAREHDSGPVLARLLGALFTACLRRDRFAELSAIAAEELSVARRLGHHELDVRALTHLGQAAERQDRFDEAVTWLEQAVRAARRPDVDRLLLASVLDGFAFALMNSGHPEQALPLFEETVAIQRDAGRPLPTAFLLYHYGMALTDAGRVADAEVALAESLRTGRAVGSEQFAAYVEQALADVDIRRGRLSVAAQRLDRARQAHELTKCGDGTAEAFRSTGDLAAAESRWSDAIGWLRRALDIWRRIESYVDIARTLARLERVHAAVGDEEAAGSCRREYRTILANLNLDDACLYLPPLAGP